MGKRSHGVSSLAEKLPKKLMAFSTWCKKKTVSRPTCPAKWKGSWSSNATVWVLNGYVEEEFWNGVRWCQKVNFGNAHKQTRKSAPTPSFSCTAKGEPVNRSFLRHLSTCAKVAYFQYLPMLVATGCLEMRPKRSQEKHLTNRFHQLTLAENKNHWSHCHLVLSQLLPWLADESHFGWLVPEFADAFAAVYLIKFCHYGWK